MFRTNWKNCCITIFPDSSEYLLLLSGVTPVLSLGICQLKSRVDNDSIHLACSFYTKSKKIVTPLSVVKGYLRVPNQTSSHEWHIEVNHQINITGLSIKLKQS